MAASYDELSAFHAAHFSSLSKDHFNQHFLGPVEAEDYYEEEEEDDGLGFYNDGVKRTLTDEQIAIFRHSEIQALLRERRHVEEARASPTLDSITTPLSVLTPLSLHSSDNLTTTEDMVAEDGEIAETKPPPRKNGKNKSRNKQNRERKSVEKGFFKKTMKPDLRKRTWDVVEKGVVEGLDYGEDNAAVDVQRKPAQRRRIAYEEG